MSAGVYNTEALISAVRLRSMLPSTDDGTSFPRDSDIISLANAEMVAMLVPWLLDAREGHYITYTTIHLVANQASYTLPARALAAGVSFLTLIDSAGNPVYPGLVESDLEVAVQYPYSQALFGQPTKYFWQGNTLTMVPTPTDSSLSVGLYYPQRPNQLVASTAVGVITGTAQLASTYTVTCSGGLPAGFTTGQTYEVVHANPGFEVVAMNSTGTVSSTTVTFTGTMPSGVNVGDSLCLQDTANFPTNVPADIYLGMFACWLALKLAEIRRDEPGQAALARQFTAAEKSAREFKGHRERLGHRKISNASNRVWGRRPMYIAK